MEVQVLRDITQSCVNSSGRFGSDLKGEVTATSESGPEAQGSAVLKDPSGTIYQQVLQIALMVSGDKNIFLIQEKEGPVGARDEDLLSRSTGFKLELDGLTQEKMASIVRSCLLRKHSNYRFCHTLANRVSRVAFESCFPVGNQGERGGISYSKYILRTDGDMPVGFTTTVKNLRTLPDRRLELDDGFTEVVHPKRAGAFQLDWESIDPLVCGKFSIERTEREMSQGVPVVVSKGSMQDNEKVCEVAGRRITDGTVEQEAFGVGLYVLVTELIKRGFSKCQMVPIWREVIEQNGEESQSVVLLINHPESESERSMDAIRQLCWDNVQETLHMTTGDGLLQMIECNTEERYDDYGDYIAVVFSRKQTADTPKQE